ncbi:MAG: DUF429 domain-containing protein [Dongiaceae bacterium]
MTLDRRRAIGVDFSGAGDAGRAIWIAEGHIRRNRSLAVEACRPASALPGGDVARAPALAALVAFLAKQRAAVIGCDFPVGLPSAVLEDGDWLRFLRGFAKRHATAEAFRAASHRAAKGCELRRPTDIAAKTPFCAWNLRLYRQTYHGIADVLAPLVARGSATVGPMQAPVEGRGWIVETCPASVLKPLGLYRPYKGRSRDSRRQRRAILDALIGLGALHPPSPAIASCAVENAGGDALDAVVAAVAAASALWDDSPVTEAERREGRVYFALRSAAGTRIGAPDSGCRSSSIGAP